MRLCLVIKGTITSDLAIQHQECNDEKVRLINPIKIR